MSENIFVARDGVKKGPFTKEQIRIKIQNGELFSNDLIWYPGLNEWTAIKNTEFYIKEETASHMPAINTYSNSSHILDCSNWGIIANTWLALLGLLFFLDQFFIIQDNPFGGLRAVIFYPWFFFSIVACGFISWADSVSKKGLKRNLTCTGVIMLFTIWTVLGAQTCWGIIAEIRENQDKNELTKRIIGRV